MQHVKYLNKMGANITAQGKSAVFEGVDFLSGATHAIDGHQQRIGDGVFLFTPANVAISQESEKKALRDSFWSNPE